jgi:CRISPR-associated endonuclease/helicase Cas3
MQITTLPVYSKLADVTTIPSELQQALPAQWQLSQHQVETYAALQGDASDVVINTAMTGDGKSLAGLLPLLVNNQHNGTMALYPTNELIQDQQRSAEAMLPQWNRASKQVAMLYGAKLDALTEAFDQLKRPDALLKVLNDHRLVLSNPDMLHAIMQFRYQQYGRVASHVIGQVPLLFEQLTFDEFHIFETPQVTAVLSGLLFLRTQQPALKTLFLSATPRPEVMELLGRVGLDTRLRLIEPQREGWYHHGADPGDGWRPILQGSHIHFAAQTAEEWIGAGGDNILLHWFQTHRPAAKAALIVNSVASALRLEQRLKPLFAAHGLEVIANTGITGRVQRTESYQADLLIGTSTVDVGVDFRINLLVFESNGAGTFMQRLGRLGRHTTYRDRDNNEQVFNTFAAYALVPPFIHARLSLSEDSAPALLQDGAVYTREQLATIINTVYPEIADFRQYNRLWGRFVPAKVYQELSRSKLRESFSQARDQLRQQYFDLTGASMVKACRDWGELRNDNVELLVTEAQSFRGGSPFECALLKDGEVVTYDLFWLLANAHLELLSREAFLRELERRHIATAAYKRGFQKFFFRWLGLRDRYEPVRVKLDSLVADWGTERQQVAQVLPGITVACNGHDDWLNMLNRMLREMRCVGLLIPGYEPLQVKRRFSLAPNFQLLPYDADSAEIGTLSGTIAFAREALLLDSRLRFCRLGAMPDGAIIH